VPSGNEVVVVGQGLNNVVVDVVGVGGVTQGGTDSGTDALLPTVADSGSEPDV
jgi:hypothetical protein